MNLGLTVRLPRDASVDGCSGYFGLVEPDVLGSCVGIDREAVWVDVRNDTNRPKPTDR